MLQPLRAGIELLTGVKGERKSNLYYLELMENKDLDQSCPLYINALFASQ